MKYPHLLLPNGSPRAGTVPYTLKFAILDLVPMLRALGFRQLPVSREKIADGEYAFGRRPSRWRFWQPLEPKVKLSLSVEPHGFIVEVRLDSSVWQVDENAAVWLALQRWAREQPTQITLDYR